MHPTTRKTKENKVKVKSKKVKVKVKGTILPKVDAA
jgi:hypothetical protein